MESDRRWNVSHPPVAKEITITRDEARALADRLFPVQDKVAVLSVVSIPCVDEDLDFWFITLADKQADGRMLDEALLRGLGALEEELPPGSMMSSTFGIDVIIDPPVVAEWLQWLRDQQQKTAGEASE